MTVSATTNRKEYAGDDVTTSFGTSPVVFFETSDLVVYVTDDTTGESTSLTEGVDYEASGGGTPAATGTIDLSSGSDPWGALADDTTLVIVRVLPLTQEVDPQNNDINDAEVTEAVFDRLTMIAQQTEASVGRALRLADSDTSGIDTTLNAVGGAGKFLRINNGGTGIEAVDGETTSDNFVASGTGAATRTVSAKLDDWVSVKDFGAVGDGSTNDTAAFTAALAASNLVFIPDGTYKVSAISIGNNQHLFGPSASISITNTSGFGIKFLNAGWAGVRIKTLDYGGVGGTTTGFAFIGSQYCSFEAREITDFPGTGLLFTGNTADGASQACNDNRAVAGLVSRNGNGVTFASKDGVSDFVVENNTADINLVIGNTSTEVNFGDDASFDTATLNVFRGIAHATVSHPPLRVLNSYNMFQGTLFRDSGSPKVSVSGGSGNMILCPNLDGSFTDNDDQIIIGNGTFDILGFRLSNESGLLTIRDKTHADDRRMFAMNASTDVVDMLNGSNMPSTAFLRANRRIVNVPGAFTSITTAGAASYTAAQFLTGNIVRDPSGGSRTDVLPSAADLVTALPSLAVGDTLTCKIVNGADANEVITVDPGSGGTYDAAQTAASRVIPQNASKTVVIRMTNVTASSEAYAVCM